MLAILRRGMSGTAFTVADLPTYPGMGMPIHLCRPISPNVLLIQSLFLPFALKDRLTVDET